MAPVPPRIIPKALHQLLHAHDEADVGAFVADPGFNRGVVRLQANGHVDDVLVFRRQLPDAGAFCAQHDSH
ncbi:hypothetical protein WT25_05695 [Burkholderia territorii]|nr:hypothetical protein WT25_05695 [Burkholderia territorii]